MLILIIVGFAATAWFQRVWVVEKSIILIAPYFNVGAVDLTVDRFDHRQISISNIQIAGQNGQRIQKFTAEYSLQGLRDGVVKRASVTGLSLRGKQTLAGYSFTGLPLPAKNQPSKPSPLIVRTLEFNHFTITLKGKSGSFLIAGDTTIETTGDGLSEVEATLKTEANTGSEKASLRSHVVATILETGEIFGQASLDDGTVSSAILNTGQIQGEVQFLIPQGNHVELDARLHTPELTVADETLHQNNIALSIRRTRDVNPKYEIETLLQSKTGTMDVVGTISQAASGDFVGVASIGADIARELMHATLKGNVTVTTSADGHVRGLLEVDKADLAYEGITLSGIQGNGEFIKARNGASKATVTATLRNFSGYGVTGNPSSLSLRIAEDSLQMDSKIGLEGGFLNIRARGPFKGKLSYEIDGSFDGAQTSASIPGRINAKGKAAFSFSGSLSEPLLALTVVEKDPWLLLENIDAKGWVESALSHLTIPDIIENGTLNGRINLSASRDGLHATTKKLRAAAKRLPESVLEYLPELLRDQFRRSIFATIEQRTGEAANISILRRADGFALAAKAALKLVAGGANHSLQGVVKATLDNNGQLSTFDGSEIRAMTASVPFAGGFVDARMTMPSLRMKENILHGEFKIEGSTNKSILNPLTLEKAEFQLAGHGELADTALSVTIDPASVVALNRLRIADTVENTLPVRVSLKHPLRAHFNIDEGLPSLRYATSIVVPDSEFRVRSGETWLGIVLSETQIALQGNGGHPHFDIAIDQIQAAAKKLSATDIKLDIDIDETAKLSLSVGELRHMEKAPFVVPLKLTASAHKTENLVTFESRLFDPPERISIRLFGEHRLDSKEGTAEIDTHKITFLPSVLQPVQLFPILGTSMREVDGELDAKGSLEWGKAHFDSSLELLVTTQTLESDEFSLKNATAIIQFDSLAPLSTAPKQEINIGSLDVGIPLLNGRAEFQLLPNGGIRGSLRELDFFGGRIETEEFTIPNSYDGFTVPLLVNGAALEDLLQRLQPKDIEATGTLNGRIPIVIKGGEVAIRGGLLESAEGGGQIRYRPAQEIGSSLEEANEGLALLLKIVDNFEYDTARVTLDEDVFGDVAFKFQIKGRNQSVHKGIPVHLNVSMDGPLRKILNQGVKSYTLPERLLSRIQEFKDAP